MAKPRVHEIASELGVDSKIALAKLKELGEFVKSPSSTIEPPVARKLRAALEADGSASAGASAPAAPAASPRPAAGRPGPARRTCGHARPRASDSRTRSRTDPGAGSTGRRPRGRRSLDSGTGSTRRARGVRSIRPRSVVRHPWRPAPGSGRRRTAGTPSRWCPASG